MHKPALAAILLTAICVPLPAQAAKPRSISARILCLQHQQDIDSVRFGPDLENLGEPQRLLIGDYSLPFPVEIPDQTLNVFKDPATADAVPIASVKIPADATTVTLLFVPGTGTPYQILPIPDSSSDFRADHTRFINLAPIPVRFRIEDQLIDLPPGKIETLGSLPKRDSHNMSNVAMASLIAGDWKVVSQTQWHFVAGNRLLILVYLRPGTQRLVSVSFKDRPGSEKPSRAGRMP
jgi:hypothetical protein